MTNFDNVDMYGWKTSWLKITDAYPYKLIGWLDDWMVGRLNDWRFDKNRNVFHKKKKDVERCEYTKIRKQTTGTHSRTKYEIITLGQTSLYSKKHK
jgi:carotenoid cleavage dioxygenase-like enzyme